MKTRIILVIATLFLVVNVAGIFGCGHHDVNQGNPTAAAPPSSDLIGPQGTEMTLNQDGEPHRTCTYYHEQGSGSQWKTKWC